MKINIGVDHGNKQIKTKNSTFVAGVIKTTQKPFMSQEFLKILNEKDEYYILSNERIPYMRDKTVDERYFILTLVAIVKELKARGIEETIVEVNLGVGLPPEHLSTLTNRFKEYFNTGGDYIRFEYGEEIYSINIYNVSVFPQGFAAIFSYLQQEAKNYPTVYLIDMGGYTVDVLEFNSGKVNFERCQSKETGVIQMYNQIIRSLRSEDVLITENEIDAVLNGNMEGICLSEADVRLIKDKANSYVEDLLYMLREENYDLKNKYTFFVGGGAILMKDTLRRNKFVGQQSRIINDISANAIGYEELISLFFKPDKAG